MQATDKGTVVRFPNAAAEAVQQAFTPGGRHVALRGRYPRNVVSLQIARNIRANTQSAPTPAMPEGWPLRNVTPAQWPLRNVTPAQWALLGPDQQAHIEKWMLLLLGIEASE